MSSTHLGEDSVFPPLTKGKLRLYSMVFCPYALRARLVLAAKNIPYETVNIKLNKKPKWYLELNPLGQVPCLQFDDGRVIPESLIVSEYLDNAYPETKLTPSDPYIKAQHQLIVESFSKVITIFYRVYRGDSTATPDLMEALETFEKKLESKYFGGESPAMVDYMVWPWFERFEYLEYAKKFEFDTKKCPKLHKYMNDMKELKAVKGTLIAPEIMDVFAKSMASNQPNYDIGLRI